jgi:hypothetical protein
MRSFSSRACRPALSLALAALGACGDYRTPTDAAADPRAHAIIGPGGDDPPPNDPPQITALSANPSTLLIEGSSASFSATLVNPGEYRYDVSVQGLIRQGTARREAVYTALSCGSGQGVLPTGTCTVSGMAVASNGGTQTLVPGPASFDIQLTGASGAVLATRSVAVTLVGPAFTALNLSSTTFLIDSSTVQYTATIENPGTSRAGVAVQGWINQTRNDGAVVNHAAGGVVVSCGTALGELPPGICAVSFAAGASNSPQVGSGTLQAGPATLVLELKAGQIVLDSITAPVNLISTLPRITELTIPNAYTEVVIDGALGRYNAVIDNPGASRDSVRVRGWVTQGPFIRRLAGTWWPACGGGMASVVLPAGRCTMDGWFSASSYNEGTGTLGPGWATFELQLVDKRGTILDTRTARVTLNIWP